MCPCVALLVAESDINSVVHRLESILDIGLAFLEGGL